MQSNAGTMEAGKVQEERRTSAGASPPLICFNAGADLDAISVLGDEENKKKLFIDLI
jgi:hypothetical protein